MRKKKFRVGIVASVFECKNWRRWIVMNKAAEGVLYRSLRLFPSAVRTVVEASFVISQVSEILRVSESERLSQ